MCSLTTPRLLLQGNELRIEVKEDRVLLLKVIGNDAILNCVFDYDVE